MKLISQLGSLFASMMPKTALAHRMNRDKLTLYNKLNPLKQDPGQKRNPTSTSGIEKELTGRDRVNMISLSRQMFYENQMFRGAIHQLVTHIVGHTGSRPTAMSEDPEWNKLLEDYFINDWAPDSHVRGGSDYFREVQPLFFNSVLRDADMGVLWTDMGKVQTIEGDRIATPNEKNKEENISIFQGVEIHPWGEPKNYFVGERMHNGMLDQKTITPIRANDMFLGYFRDERASQYRGVSKFMSCFDAFRDIKDVMSYAQYQQKMASIFGVFVTRDSVTGKNPLDGIGGDGTKKNVGSNAELKDLTPGMVHVGNKGEKPEIITNPNPGDNFRNYMVLASRTAGLSTGLPIELLLLDFSNGNFSSQKMAMQTAYRSFLTLANELQRFNQWVWNKVILTAIMEGKIEWSKALPLNYLACDWSEPLHPSVDPEAEVDAAAKRIAAGLSTLEIEAKKFGRKWLDIIEQRSIEIQTQLDKNVPVVMGQPGTPILQEQEYQNAKTKKQDEGEE